eukprot:TRINITY_DN58176_c0_g1_i1.p1 TRINITY_DN58176_c0_g1~~TRINITY_DN58176_c0_g1_i1.p1  ORF type:complete len:710 (-),score=58.36 TRINITY_DN58176_c0_g1_i1:45-2174(-)
MSQAATKCQEFMSSGPVHCARWGKQSGQLIALGGQDRKVNIWRLGCPSGQPITQLHGHTSSISAVVFDPEEQTAASGSAGGSIKAYDINTERATRSFHYAHKCEVTSLDWAPPHTANLFISGGGDAACKLWDERGKNHVHAFKGHSAPINCVKFTPDCRRVVTGCTDGTVKLWDLTTNKQVGDNFHHGGEITSLDFHPIEYLLAVGSADKTVTFWDLDLFQAISQTTYDNRATRCITFTPDGAALCGATSDALKLWGWEPACCHDSVDVHWSNVADLYVSKQEGNVYGVSFMESFVSIYMINLQDCRPFATGEGGYGHHRIAADISEEALPVHPHVPSRITQHHRTDLHDVVLEEYSSVTSQNSQLQQTTQKRMSTHHQVETFAQHHKNQRKPQVVVVNETPVHNNISATATTTTTPTKPHHQRQKTKTPQHASKSQPHSHHSSHTHSHNHHNSSTVTRERTSMSMQHQVSYSHSDAPTMRKQHQPQYYQTPEKAERTGHPKTLNSPDDGRLVPSNHKQPLGIIPSQYATQPQIGPINVEEILTTSEELKRVMRERLMHIKLLKALWAQDKKGAIFRVNQLNDRGVAVDFLRQAMKSKQKELTLDMCVSLLYIVRPILGSQYESYLQTALDCALTLWRAFGDLVNKTLAVHAVGLDLSLEERKDKCRTIKLLFGEVRQMVELLKSRKDEIGNKSRLLYRELPATEGFEH